MSDAEKLLLILGLTALYIVFRIRIFRLRWRGLRARIDAARRERGE